MRQIIDDFFVKSEAQRCRECLGLYALALEELSNQIERSISRLTTHCNCNFRGFHNT